jgi:hypothetical protein
MVNHSRECAVAEAANKESDCQKVTVLRQPVISVIFFFVNSFPWSRPAYAVFGLCV